jgi:hypothetical protein
MVADDRTAPEMGSPRRGLKLQLQDKCSVLKVVKPTESRVSLVSVGVIDVVSCIHYHDDHSLFCHNLPLPWDSVKCEHVFIFINKFHNFIVNKLILHSFFHHIIIIVESQRTLFGTKPNHQAICVWLFPCCHM